MSRRPPIYESDLIEPGKAITEFQVSEPLEAGEYEIHLNISAYTMDENLSPLNGADVKAVLHVVKIKEDMTMKKAFTAAAAMAVAVISTVATVSAANTESGRTDLTLYVPNDPVYHHHRSGDRSAQAPPRTPRYRLPPAM